MAQSKSDAEVAGAVRLRTSTYSTLFTLRQYQACILSNLQRRLFRETTLLAS